MHDYPLTGDDVHEFFLRYTTPIGPLRHGHGHRRAAYRLDPREKAVPVGYAK